MDNDPDLVQGYCLLFIIDSINKRGEFNNMKIKVDTLGGFTEKDGSLN
jgi:hypothetical protein